MTRRRPAIVVRIPGAPEQYSQNEEAQFRGVVENSLTTFQSKLAAEPLFLDAFASVDEDGDLNFEYKLNVPYGVSIGYAWEATKDSAGAAMPSDASVTGGTHTNYAVNNSPDGEIQIVAAKATLNSEEIFLKVVAFSDVSATGRDGQVVEFHLKVEVPGGGGSLPDGSVIADKLSDQARKFTTDIVFTATDYRVVAWSAGTIKLANGDTFSIGANNTANMGAAPQLTYIYLNREDSTTQLQTSTNYANVVSDDVVLLAVAKAAASTSQKAFFVPGVGVFGLNAENLSPDIISATEIQTNAVTTPKLITNAVTAAKITAGNVTTAKIAAGAITVDEIATNTITAAKMDVVNLSSIHANIGTITAGLLQNAAGTRYIDLTTSGTDPFIKHPAFELLHDGTATFSGTVSAQSFTGTTATFNGSISVKGGGSTVSAKIVNFAFEVYDSGGTKTTTVGLAGTNSRIQAEQGDMQVNCTTAGGDVDLNPGSSGFVNFKVNTGTAGAIAGYIKCQINGTERRMAYYATS